MEHQAVGLVRRRGDVRGHARPNHRPLAIVSGKGGVGKSALGVNLALAAAATGATTLLIDGDVGLANADLLMGLVPSHDLSDVALGRASRDQALCRGLHGIDLLGVGASKAGVDLLLRALSGRDAEWARCIAERRLALLDLGAGIGRDVLALAGACDPVWLVATPEPTSLADAYAIAKQLWEEEPALRIELVVNRAVDRSAGERTHRALDRLVKRFLDRSLTLRAILPEDPAMGRAVARQVPVVVGEPGSAIARRIRLLAESLLEERSGSARPVAPIGAFQRNP